MIFWFFCKLVIWLVCFFKIFLVFLSCWLSVLFFFINFLYIFLSFMYCVCVVLVVVLILCWVCWVDLVFCKMFIFCLVSLCLICVWFVFFWVWNVSSMFCMWWWVVCILIWMCLVIRFWSMWWRVLGDVFEICFCVGVMYLGMLFFFLIVVKLVFGGEMMLVSCEDLLKVWVLKGVVVVMLGICEEGGGVRDEGIMVGMVRLLVLLDWKDVVVWFSGELGILVVGMFCCDMGMIVLLLRGVLGLLIMRWFL